MKKSSSKGISRIESEDSHTYGWYVRVRFDGKVKSKFFSDRKNGGVAQALNKARRFYKREMQTILVKTHGAAPEKLPNRILVTKNKNNNTGIVGVQKIERQNAGGSIYEAYRVCWTEKNGKARTKFFSVAKFGDQEAFKKACEFRRERIFEG